MREIDLETWNRAHLFRQYQGADLPYIIISARTDVTGLLKWSKANQVSFYFALVHIATQTADKIENFHYRFDGDKILRIDHNVPLFNPYEKGGGSVHHAGRNGDRGSSAVLPRLERKKPTTSTIIEGKLSFTDTI